MKVIVPHVKAPGKSKINDYNHYYHYHYYYYCYYYYYYTTTRQQIRMGKRHGRKTSQSVPHHVRKPSMNIMNTPFPPSLKTALFTNNVVGCGSWPSVFSEHVPPTPNQSTFELYQQFYQLTSACC
jgi:hypothetical protein